MGAMCQFQKSLENNSVSVFRVPSSNTEVPMKKEDPKNFIKVMTLDSESTCKTPEKVTHFYHDSQTPDGGKKEDPKSTSKGHSRNPPAIIEQESEVCIKTVTVPSSCSAKTKAETNVRKRSMNQIQPVHPEINENQPQSYPSKKNQLGDRKRAHKRSNVPGHQDCHLNTGLNVTFQHLRNMDFSVNKRSHVTRGRPSVRGRPAQLVPVSQPLVNFNCSTDQCTPVKKTKITVSFPPMSHQTENQLLRVFFEISKLHGCDVSVDRKETLMKNESKSSNLTSHHHGSSQQLTKLADIQTIEFQQLKKKQQKSAAFQPSLPKLRTLQSKLHTLGTHIQPLEVEQVLPQEQTQCPDSSSDFDSSLLLYPEVIMNSSP